MMYRLPRPPDLLRRPPALKVCGICRALFGPDQKATLDHVLPKGFFSRPLPKNLPTWRVCEQCQDSLDPAEERLRNIFALAYSHDPAANRDVFERARRSHRQVAPEKRVWLRNLSGVLEHTLVARPHPRDLEVVFAKVVAGLFYWRHHRLAPTADALVRGVLSVEAFDYWSGVAIDQMKLPIQSLGQVAWVSQSDPALRSGFWLFMLNDAVGVGVWAGEMANRPDIPKSSSVAVRI